MEVLTFPQDFYDKSTASTIKWNERSSKLYAIEKVSYHETPAYNTISFESHCKGVESDGTHNHPDLLAKIVTINLKSISLVITNGYKYWMNSEFQDRVKTYVKLMLLHKAGVCTYE